MKPPFLGSDRFSTWSTYLAQPDGNYEIGECYLTVSLGEPFGDACYKLIAAVIELD